jgi:Txe/YoeB family toxin of Txe-Axe toxin-antitoxin module
MTIEFSKNAWEDFEYWMDVDTELCYKEHLSKELVSLNL